MENFKYDYHAFGCNVWRTLRFSLRGSLPLSDSFPSPTPQDSNALILDIPELAVGGSGATTIFELVYKLICSPGESFPSLRKFGKMEGGA